MVVETKVWFASKTLWVNFIAVIAAVASAFGLDLGLDPESQVAIVGGVMAVVNIMLRFATTTALGAASD